MEDKAKLSLRLENLSVFLLGILLFLFPLILLTLTTDAYVIPKQAILALVSIIGILFLGVKGVLNNAVKLKRTPFDLPLVLFGFAALLSSIFAVNKADSFISFIPFLFALLLFFVITNSVRREKDLMFLNGSLILGAVILSLITLLSYLKIYILPFPFAKAQTFTPFGSLFDQAQYLLVVLSLCLYTAWPALKRRSVDKGRLIFVIGAFLTLVGVVVTLIAMMTLQKPIILPYQTGFQTAFAAISQDTGRVVQGFLMGSGIGTFLTDFTRFKPATFNADAALWNLSFLRSSSFILELLTTTGLLGILSFIFLAFRILKSKPLFAPLVLILVLALILPFSYAGIALLFIVLGLYSAQQGLNERQKTKFFDVELKLVALKRGVFALADPGSKVESEYQNVLPYGFLGLTVAFLLLVGIPSARFLASDYLFQKSLVAANANNAQTTYQLQTQAINMFRQRDGYHRIFAQVNLSLANNLTAGIPKGSSPSAQVQNSIYQLIQQSINSGRNATTVSPQSAINWQNLSSIYRSLIGFGQNADTFSLLANQQAVTLDPSNPQEYINYGGIFFQLGQWDNAIRQFQIAVSLKPDFANAYYNLGHAYEQKGDFAQALAQYQTVKSLVPNDKPSLDQINKEITAVQAKIGSAEQNAQQTQAPASGQNQPPIEVNQPSQQLPTQYPPIKIPGPTATPKATPTPAK